MQDLRTCFEEPYRDDEHPCPALETTSEQAQRIHGIAFSFTACRKNCEPKVPSSKLTAASMFKPQLQQSSRKAQHMTKKIGAFIARSLQPYSMVNLRRSPTGVRENSDPGSSNVSDGPARKAKNLGRTISRKCACL